MRIVVSLEGLVDKDTEGGLEDGIERNIGRVEESHDGTKGGDVLGVALATGKTSLDVGGQGDIASSPTKGYWHEDGSEGPSIPDVVDGRVVVGENPDDE